MKLTCCFQEVRAEFVIDSPSTSPADLIAIACVHLGIDPTLVQTTPSQDANSFVYAVDIQGKGNLVELCGAATNVQGTALADGDILTVQPARSGSSSSAPNSNESRNSQTYRSLRDLPPGMSPQVLYTTLRTHDHLIKELRHHNPKLAEAALKDDGGESLRGVLIEQQLSRSMEEHRRNEMRRRIIENPMDPEVQAHMLEEIQQKAIQDNMEMAMEQTPESFGRVLMLYVPVEVNGNKIKAFVDSGAQMTIMSESCANRTGLMRLVDRRFAGQAVGVGSAKILGKIHIARLSWETLSLTARSQFWKTTKLRWNAGAAWTFFLGLICSNGTVHASISLPTCCVWRAQMDLRVWHF